MAIKHITVSNFKSFKEVDVELGNFNVLIGANASGKSNFVSLFQFLRDIVDDGLKNAISQQGGVEYFRNTRLGASYKFALKYVSDVSVEFGLFREADTEKRIDAVASGVTYEFEIFFREHSSDFDIAKDSLVFHCDFREYEANGNKKSRKLGKGDFYINSTSGQVSSGLSTPFSSDDLGAYRWLPYVPAIQALPLKTLLLERQLVVAYPSEGDHNSHIDDIAVYDFDPKELKKATSPFGKSELEGNGSNLAIVLKEIVEDPEKKRKLSNLLRDLLPFVEDFNVTRFADKSMITAFREIYSGDSYLPASFMSDGTVNVLALVIALYFEDNSIVIIEEPERNIHPHLISKVMGMLKEVSEQKQIIITTQNPEIVRHADLRAILLISRDKEGFSQISRPVEKEGVRTFLENEIGIEELYVRNLLGA